MGGMSDVSVNCWMSWYTRVYISCKKNFGKALNNIKFEGLK